MTAKNTASFQLGKLPAGVNFSGWALRAGVFLLAVILATVILTAVRDSGVGGDEFVIGEPAPRTAFAPFEISFVDENMTSYLREEKSAKVLPVYAVNAQLLKETAYKVDQLFEAIHTAERKATEGVPLPAAVALETLPLKISETSFNYLLQSASLEEARKQLEILLDYYRSLAVIDADMKQQLISRGITHLSVVFAYGNSEKDMALADLPVPRDVVQTGMTMLPQNVQKDRGLKQVLQEIFQNTVQASLEEDVKGYQSRREKAAATVEPRYISLKKNELIVQRGIRVTPNDKIKLDSVQKAQVKRRVLHEIASVAILAFLVYLLCLVYLFMLDRKTLLSWKLLLFFHTVVLTSLILCKAVLLWPGASPYLMPVSLASLLLVLLARARLGILSALMMPLLTAPMSQYRADLMMISLVTSLAGVLAASRVRKRMEFIKVGLAIAVSYTLVLFSLRMMEDLPLWKSFQFSASLGLTNGFLIVMPICFLLPPFLEYVFDLISDITLLELSDLNHPLLKRMIIEAPGTYHHSLVVSRLAESACEEIHANALLARVGCYFHDIGKIAKSEYFVENLGRAASSLHTGLTPQASSYVIRDHVKDGIKLGKRYKLRQRILDFIPEHQGKGVIYYFYRKAVDQSLPGEIINADDFRYAGPKPQSRETAVAMLADSTEAASRSIKEPTRENLRQLVRKIINDKFIDGQLDECDLTLKDLHRIQESFVHNLMAIFHTRVSYPAVPRDDESPDLFQKGEFSKYQTKNSASRDS